LFKNFYRLFIWEKVDPDIGASEKFKGNLTQNQAEPEHIFVYYRRFVFSLDGTSAKQRTSFFIGVDECTIVKAIRIHSSP
jgi:hypothetical protein